MAKLKSNSAPLSASKARRPARELAHSDAAETISLVTFSTPLGWFGLLGKGDQLLSVIAGHSTKKSVESAAKHYGDVKPDNRWSPELREKFDAYAHGEMVDFLDVPIRLPEMTTFQLSVANATRRIPYGATVSYGELAGLAGYPRAARAVGTVMSQNRFPILIPCHRVLASGGKLGGYTSVAGVNFKARLLEMESQVNEPLPVRILSR